MEVLSPLYYLLYLTSSGGIFSAIRNMHDARDPAELVPELLGEITKGSEHGQRKLALALSLHTTNDRRSRSKHLETAVFQLPPAESRASKQVITLHRGRRFIRTNSRCITRSHTPFSPSRPGSLCLEKVNFPACSCCWLARSIHTETSSE
jgi:hypothetical protein